MDPMGKEKFEDRKIPLRTVGSCPAFPTWIEVVSIEVEPEHAVVSQCPGVPRNGTAFRGIALYLYFLGLLVFLAAPDAKWTNY